ncbi:MAG: molybdate transport system substrate-binding protein [Nocardioidaceae bacterium]|jgi:molybdate transport system substrate-binding protein|nr:molybdate transport system substrate-binding protein [Nocardioidaceae bacterium]
MRRILAVAMAAGVALTSLVACGGSADKNSNTNSAAPTGKLTVFAASSLTGTFTTLKSQFEKAHPGVNVELSFGSSTTLADQITAGAPADVIATADQASISGPEKAGQLAAKPVEFATNKLIIAVPPNNPGGVTGVSTLNKATFVMCDVSAPCGAAGSQMLKNAGVTAQPKAFFPDVATTLTQVELGEADAGIVYVTDAMGAGSKVKAIPIPASDNVTNPYFIAAVKDSKQAQLAKDWDTLVSSPTGQSVLQKAGFGAP